MFLNVNPINSQPSFGAKLPTVNILEVLTGCILEKDGRLNGVFNVCNTMLDTGHSMMDLPNSGRKCREALIKQFPVLGEIRTESIEFFKTEKSLQEVTEWVASQIKKIGSSEMDVAKVTSSYNFIA